MRRLYYIFWAVPVFMLACAGPKPATLQYRPEFLAGETATATPAGAVFDPPALAHTSIFGADEIDGVNLNYRAQTESTAGYVEGEDFVDFRLYYYDRQGDPFGHFGHFGHHDNGYLNRTFSYTRTGTQAR